MQDSRGSDSLDASLVAAFAQFRDDPVTQFMVQLRRHRAQELRSLFAAAPAMDLATFNRDIWTYCSAASCAGEDVTSLLRSYNIPAESVAKLKRHLEAGTLELHGNFIWGSGSRVFGAMLSGDQADRTQSIRQAIAILNDATLSPLQKAKRLLEIRGFGKNIATGLVMVCHPAEFAIWNTPSASAVSKLGYQARTLPEFQEVATELCEELGATDFLELDYFLFLIEQGDTRVELPETVWWINQGTMYDAERRGGYVFAPLQSVNNRAVRHYTNLALMKPGQTTLHYSGQALRAIGTVTKAAEQGTRPDPKPGEDEGRLGNLVRVAYQPIEPPIAFSELSPDWITVEDDAFNRNKGVKEGYAFPVSATFLERLKSAFKDRIADTSLPTTERRIVKIAPGENACFWEICLKQGFVCVGWGKTGDLRDYANKEAFRKAFRERYSEIYNHYESTISRKANEVWTLRELRPGDIVVANRGTSRVLGIGEVLDPPYEFQEDPDRGEFSHLVRVRWTSTVAKDIPHQGYWAMATIADVPKDLFQLIVEGERATEPKPFDDYVEPSFDEIARQIAAKGLRISERTLRRYHLSLKTRGFVILCGLSGSGKTWLAELYAKIVGAEQALVAVAPNWTTNEDLIGYFNPMDGQYHDTPFSTFLRRAAEHYEEAEAAGVTARPFHLILDEMNLARVEYYFAKFLSAMEQRARQTQATIDLGGNSYVILPPNLFFIGTVNIDETTHGFADKVYDRAQLIEVDVSPDALRDHLGAAAYAPAMLEIWEIVRDVTPFAFRVLDEIRTYVSAAQEIGIPWEEALDEQLLQKILTKVKGAEQRVQHVLEQFLLKSADRFPLSHAKATRMLETLQHHGITSYF